MKGNIHFLILVTRSEIRTRRPLLHLLLLLSVIFTIRILRKGLVLHLSQSFTVNSFTATITFFLVYLGASVILIKQIESKILFSYKFFNICFFWFFKKYFFFSFFSLCFIENLINR